LLPASLAACLENILSKENEKNSVDKVNGIYYHLHMNEIATNSIDIKSLILTVRGMQVLLDSDVAMLYGYGDEKYQ